MIYTLTDIVKKEKKGNCKKWFLKITVWNFYSMKIEDYIDWDVIIKSNKVECTNNSYNLLSIILLPCAFLLGGICNMSHVPREHFTPCLWAESIAPETCFPRVTPHQTDLVSDSDLEWNLNKFHSNAYMSKCLSRILSSHKNKIMKSFAFIYM